MTGQNKTFFSSNLKIIFLSNLGINGRPELIIEGSNDLSSVTNWKEYHFLYKPGDVSKAPKFISKLNI
jgi:hypothetical protein